MANGEILGAIQTLESRYKQHADGASPPVVDQPSGWYPPETYVDRRAPDPNLLLRGRPARRGGPVAVPGRRCIAAYPLAQVREAAERVLHQGRPEGHPAVQVAHPHADYGERRRGGGCDLGDQWVCVDLEEGDGRGREEGWEGGEYHEVGGGGIGGDLFVG